MATLCVAHRPCDFFTRRYATHCLHIRDDFATRPHFLIRPVQIANLVILFRRSFHQDVGGRPPVRGDGAPREC